MKIAVLGLGYVGLANVAFLVEHTRASVVAYDVDEAKLSALKSLQFPFEEPLLNSVLQKDARKILYTASLDDLKDADAYILAVGTPSKADGTADLSALDSALDTIEKVSSGSKIIIRSTVPVGTAKKVGERLRAFSVISMPEFLAEGRSYEDESKPFRIVIGARKDEDFAFIRNLRKSDVNGGTPFYFMSNESAELTKYASNMFLSMKISYINEMSRLSEALGADIEDVAMAMGADPRIGHSMLKAGLGYGGSCFPKDGKALMETADEEGVSMLLPEATAAVNFTQPLYFLKKVHARFPDLKGVKIALLGLAYKAGTSDLRNALSLVLAKPLLDAGAVLTGYDPSAKARSAFSQACPQVKVSATKDEALKDADALIIVTEEREFARLDEQVLLSLMKGRVIFDGRNLYPVHRFVYFDYVSVGRSEGKAQTK
jgi:UDPglucose 6-dehydrogenase